MKHLYIILFSFSCYLYGQQPYYDSINFDGLSGADLSTELSNLINMASATYTYGAVRDDFKIIELDPANTNNVLLTYGWVNNLSCITGDTDRRIRDKNRFGGNSCEYNREHVFARSNANPAMGTVDNNTTGIGADPHNLKATDVQRNGIRGNKKFAAGSGNSGDVGSGNWYPGDEWRGDVDRIMMYMYVRYGDRCLPKLNAVGPKEGTTDMLQILLQWNAEDEVSDIEDNRNNHLETVYGNRNPFIDNPYLATLIWGGTPATDRWGTLSTDNFEETEVSIFPNPVVGDEINIISNAELSVQIFDILGKKVKQQNISNNQKKVNLESLKSGVYILKLKSDTKTISRKLIKL